MSKLLTGQDYINAAKSLDVELAVIKAVAEVESAGDGFLPSGQPKILFEGHIFHKITDGLFDDTHPTISYPTWTKKYYLGGQKEYERFLEAKKLDPQAAIRSASWGKFQILGNNYREAGFVSVEDFFWAMNQDEWHHLKAFVSFIISKGLVEALQQNKWAEFARAYNGPGFRKNDYDWKLEQAYLKHKVIPT